MKKLLALFLFSVLFLVACDMFNADIPEYLEYHASTVAIKGHELDGFYPSDINGIVNITPEEDRRITFTLRNPEQYDINMGINWNNSNLLSSSGSGVPQPTIDYIFTQNPTDKTIVYLTLTQAFLKSTDNAQVHDDISGSITLTESGSGRVFESYAYSLVSNSPPPPVESPLLMKEDAGNHFVLCFKLPDFTLNPNQQDIRKLQITDTVTGTPIAEYDIAPRDASGTIMFGDEAITGDKSNIITGVPNLVALEDGGTVFPSDYDSGGHGIFYRTDVPINDFIGYTITLIDDKGLSSKVGISSEPIIVPGVGDIYIDGVNGNNNNDGLSPSTAVQTFNVGVSKILNDKTIWITNTISVTGGEMWNLSAKSGVIVKRYGGDGDLFPAFTNALVNVANGGSLTLENITIDGNQVVDSESAIIRVSNGTLQLNSGTILQNNKNSSGNGGGVYVETGQFLMYDGLITNNVALNGGGVYLKNISHSIYGGEITKNTTSTNGGGVFLHSNVMALNLAGGGIINISDNKKGVDQNNIAYTNTSSSPITVYGGISVASGTKIGLSPSNKAEGAVLVTNTMDVDLFKMDDNSSLREFGYNLIVPTMNVYLDPSAVDDGNGTEASPVNSMSSAISYLTDNAETFPPNATMWVMNTIDIASDTDWDYSGLTLKRHRSHEFALVNITGGTLILENIIIDGNKDNVSAKSAMITVNGGTLQLNSGAILQNNKNVTPSGNGGGVFVWSGTLNLQGGQITKNSSAGNGGGVLLYSGTLEMDGGSITNNTSTAIGGGVYIENGATLNLGGEIDISGNTMGGAPNNIAYTNDASTSPVKVIDTITLASGTQIGLSPSNTAAGAMLVQGTSGFGPNIAHFTRDDGVNDMIVDSPNLIIPVPVIPVLGDIYINGVSGDDGRTGTSVDKAVKTFRTASSKVADGNTIWIVNTININGTENWNLTEKTNVTVKRYDGGGTATDAFKGALVEVNTGATLTLTNITIDGQGGVVSGSGAVNAEEAIIKIANDGILNLNTDAILQNNRNSKNGGGVNVLKGTLTINGGIITSNTAASGGGVYMENGIFTFTTGEITGNTATINGGGVRLETGNFTIESGKINTNTASENGGGVYMEGGTFTLTGGEITGNTASINGGGVRGAGAVTINGGKINTNTASQSGGGVHMEGGIFEITAGEIISNVASINGGGVRIGDGTHKISGGTISANKAVSGAGVYLENNGILNLSGTLNISENTSNTAANNIAYTNQTGNSPVKVAGAITLVGNKKIGLSPTNKTENAMLVQATDATNLDESHFSLDGASSGSLIKKDITGNLIITISP